MRRAAFAAFLFATTASAALAAPGTACTALADLKLADVTITAAEQVSPGWKYPASPFNGFLGPRAAAQTSFCRVALTIEKEIKVEVWLPDVWNQRFQGVGNGGLTGAINYPGMADAVKGGFATASTDTGHQTPDSFFDSSWVAGHPDRVENFGYRGHHLMAVTAKKIVAAYYGTPVKKAYYTGCSSGGWQGLTEAQRYPDDYDGIVAGAPAMNFVRLQSNGFYTAYISRRTPGGDIPPDKQKMMAAAMMAKCDASDGLKDGLITDPRLCKFDFQEIQCKSGDKPDCLTKAQVARAKMLYGPRPTKNGVKLYPGQPLGVPPANIFASGTDDPFDKTMMILALKEKPKWRTATFEPLRDLPPLEKELGWLDSDNPDLSAFKARGGKLLMYHGWADPGLPPYVSLDYFAAVNKAVPDANNFLRLFMIPGMGHCGGGIGPNAFDSTAAIVDWVEKDEAPERLIGYHTNEDGTIGMTRPLCAEPKVAVYSGSGSTDEAKNFVCKVSQKAAK